MGTDFLDHLLIGKASLRNENLSYQPKDSASTTGSGSNIKVTGDKRVHQERTGWRENLSYIEHAEYVELRGETRKSEHNEVAATATHGCS